MTHPFQAQLVFCTCPDEEVARDLAKKLIEQRLGACVNTLPGIHSMYQWKDQVCEDTECLLLIKTTAEQLPALQTAIAAMHPYELPEIIAVPISAGLPAYLDWIQASVKDFA